MNAEQQLENNALYCDTWHKLFLTLVLDIYGLEVFF